MAGAVCALDVVFVLVFGLALLDYAARFDAPPALVRALLVIPLATTLLSLGAAGCAVLVWRRRAWGVVSRLHYTAVVLAGLGFPVWLNAWNLLGFRG